MKRAEFDTLYKLLSEDLLPEFKILSDVESFWVVLNTAQAEGATKILDVGRKGHANLCFWNHMVNSGSTIIGVNSDVVALDIVGVALEDRNSFTSLIMADPGDYYTFSEVKKLVGGTPVDFLCLDGLCDFDTLKNDFEMYDPVVRPGGKIAIGNLHDLPVKLFWDSIHYPKKVVYGDGAGVGVITR